VFYRPNDNKKSATSRKVPGEKEDGEQSGSLNFDLAHVDVIKLHTQASAGKKFTVDAKTGLIQLNTVDSENFETKDQMTDTFHMF
jgi:hypothetical protein